MSEQTKVPKRIARTVLNSLKGWSVREKTSRWWKTTERTSWTSWEV